MESELISLTEIYVLEEHNGYETLDTSFFKSVEGALNSLLNKDEFVSMNIKTGNNEIYPDVIEIELTYKISFSAIAHEYKSEYTLYIMELGE